MQFIIPLLVAIGLSIAALITVNADGQQGGSKNSLATAVSETTTLATNIQSGYSVGGSFATLTTAVAISNGYAPSNMIDGTNLVDPWGGTVTVQPDPNNSAEFDELAGTVPQASCANYAGGVSSAVGVEINGGTALTPPVDPSAAAADCEAGNNTITFVFASS